MKTKTIRAAIAAICVAAALPSYAETASATASEPIAVSTRDARLVSPQDIEYSPAWCGATEAGAYVVIEKVVNSVTSVVTTCSADAEGAYAYSLGAGDDPCMRLIHHVYSSGGTEIGTPLVRDVAFGVVSAPSAQTFADCRAESLAEVIAADGKASLTYDTAWATNATAVTLSAVKLTGEGGTATDTKTLFTSAADAVGEQTTRGLKQGWWRFICRVDATGGDYIEYEADDVRIKSGGLMLIVR